MNDGKQISLSDYLYELPDERIAYHPPKERGSSKLLVYKEGEVQHRSFGEIADMLPKNSLLVFNESRVIPARIRAQTERGKAIELFLLKPVGNQDPVAALNAFGQSTWECMVGRRKDWKAEETLSFSLDGITLKASWGDREINQVRFSWEPAQFAFAEILERVGKIPLPPYISREVDEDDKQTYQTVYAKTEGSVAAPTAGLHFTDDILAGLIKKGHQTDFVTLHVGAGTFMPVKVDNMLEHTMHSELISVRKAFVDHLAAHEGPLVPVGTTSLRTLETLWHIGVGEGIARKIEQFPASSSKNASMQDAMKMLSKKMEQAGMEQISAETSIMIFPGYALHACDALVTNFHQPGSTLLMLVSALLGEAWKLVYQDALSNGYRFLSYGDSSLLFAKDAI